ncbi:NAD(P)-binding protein [Pholiota conissans]|uniref:NAD(P)-binding protein n=1 Tax=Pholiota conissans TaxID=109636 RepID=A0A9P5YU50_9AGAR|nr:NAD(P)-binding protein [Pholiota conissans]
MAEAQKIYLITGANRGIGLALVDAIVSKYPTSFVYAGVRDPSLAKSTAQLDGLIAKYPGRVEVVKCVSADKEDNDALAKQIGQRWGRIDVVIANAGISNSVSKVHETPIAQFEDHFSINVLGPIALFQAFYDLLKASPHQPRFIPISSGCGSLVIMPPLPLEVSAYGTSKAALNWATRKIHFENEWLVSFPLCPGAVGTDMVGHSISLDKSGNMGEYFSQTIPRPPSVAAGMLLDIIMNATRENEGGQFVNIEGGRHPW